MANTAPGGAAKLAYRFSGLHSVGDLLCITVCVVWGEGSGRQRTCHAPATSFTDAVHIVLQPGSVEVEGDAEEAAHGGGAGPGAGQMEAAVLTDTEVSDSAASSVAEEVALLDGGQEGVQVLDGGMGHLAGGGGLAAVAGATAPSRPRLLRAAAVT